MSIKKNMLSNFMLSSSTFIFPLITFPYITRTLSNESLGSVLYVDSFTQYFIIFSALGIPLYGVREISKVKGDVKARSKLVYELLIIKVSLALVSILIFLSLLRLVPSFLENTTLIKLGCLSIISSSFLIEWFYQGIENYTYITKRTLFIKTLSVIAILLLVKHFDDKLIYYAILVGVNALNALINFSYYLKAHHNKFVEPLELRKHLRPLTTLFFISVAISVYTVLDIMILGTLTNPKEVSLYSVPLRLTKIVWTVVLGIGFVVVPRVSALFKQNMLEDIKILMTKSFSIVFLITIPFCFYSLIFTKELLTLVAGNNYLNAINALKLFSFLPLIIGICNIMGTQFLLPIGKEKQMLHATLIGLGLSLLLNFLLIPHFGFMGAATACLIAETAVCTYICFIAIKEININIDLNLLKLIILSLVVTAISFYLTQHQIKDTYAIIVSGGVYTFSFLMLHFFYFKNDFVNSILNSVYPIIKSK